MKLSHSKSRIEKDQILWLLYSYRIELSKSELFDMVKHIKKEGLFSYLEKERPALKNQLISILNQSIETDYWENLDKKLSREQYMESYLEQCILEIYQRLKK